MSLPLDKDSRAAADRARAETAANNASQSESAAALSEQEALAARNQAVTSASEALESENNAGQSAVSAQTSANDAEFWATAPSIDTVFYASATTGDDDLNDGKTLSKPFLTIKKAIEDANAYVQANQGSRATVVVTPGTYEEVAPISVSDNISIIGNDLRTTIVGPTSATKNENLFLLGNACYVWGLRLQGCEVDSLSNPTTGFFFAFRPGAFITTSPYVQNCTASYAPRDKQFVPINFDSGNPLVGNGPGGMLVDDTILDPYSPLKSMIVDAYTQVAFNGIGICVKGRGYAQLVSFFTNFSRIGVYCLTGGHASLLNSNTTFGDYGLYAKGKRQLVIPDVSGINTYTNTPFHDVLVQDRETIVNLAYQGFLALPPPSGIDYTQNQSFEDSTKKDYGFLVDAIASDFRSQRVQRLVQFITGLFRPNTTTGNIEPVWPLTPTDITQDFLVSFDVLRTILINYADNNIPPGQPLTMATQRINQMIDVVKDTITSVVVNGSQDLIQDFGSLITSTSHDFSYAGSGVNFLGLPINQGGIGQSNIDIRIVQEEGGRVYHSSGDEEGDFFVGNDFRIRQDSGTIDGRTFQRSLLGIVTPFVLALEDTK